MTARQRIINAAEEHGLRVRSINRAKGEWVLKLDRGRPTIVERRATEVVAAIKGIGASMAPTSIGDQHWGRIMLIRELRRSIAAGEEFDEELARSLGDCLCRGDGECR